MPIRLTVTLTISLLLWGASYAFAGGLLNDAQTTRAAGGVGNYLFRSTAASPLAPEDQNELINSEAGAFESGPTYDGFEELSVRQSSAIAPTPEITFRRNSAEIAESEKDHLDEIAATLKGNPALTARITGYADHEGSSEENRRLASARAQAVAHNLEGRGISANRLTASAGVNGESEGRTQNRRVDVQFQ
jgi:outer membrane protein OmpA-like peptidoglycan-associated protein